MKSKRLQPNQIILHIPHNSTRIPERCQSLFYLNHQQMLEELLRMTDSHTDELFDLPQIPKENRIAFPYSRLICDVERFRDDENEHMAKRGMGVCYEMTSDLKPLKRVTPEHKTEMLRLYDHHHALLTAAACRVIDTFGTGLLIDCHSFASQQLPYEAVGAKNGNRPRPDICIGTDPVCHTPDWLRQRLVRAFELRGYSVALNEPFHGTLVPMRFYHRDRRLLSVMIEVNRGLYMEERTGRKKEQFAEVRSDIERVFSELWRG